MHGRLHSTIVAVAECFVIGAFIAAAALVSFASTLAPFQLR